MEHLSEQEYIALKPLLKAADKIKDCGVIYNFICPKCGGKIIAERSANNGHLHIKCDNCRLSIIG
jgi:hypothetical protein